MGTEPEKKLTYRGKFVIRTLGAIFIMTCFVMFVLGQTWLKDDLAGLQYVLYWSWCLLVAMLAALVSMVDMIFVRRAADQNRRELFRRQFIDKK